MDDKDTLPFYFAWKTCRPDMREYRQQSLELEPSNISIQIDVPADPIYVVPNKEKTLTLAGLKYVVDALDTVFLPKKNEAKADVDDDWETDVSTNRPAVSKDGKDDWDDADFDDDKKGKDELPWDEKEEEWE